MLLVNSSSRVSNLFEVNGLTHENHSSLHSIRSLNDALEQCEDKLVFEEKERIKKSQIDGKNSGNELFQRVYEDMMAALEVQISFEPIIERTGKYLKKLTVNEGDFLFAQGEANSDLFFITRGQIAILNNNIDGQKRRVRTLGAWSIIGELGSYLGYHASHDAMVVKKGVVYKLSTEARKKLDTEDQTLMAEVDKLVIQMLGRQLLKTSRVTEV